MTGISDSDLGANIMTLPELVNADSWLVDRADGWRQFWRKVPDNFGHRFSPLL